jgi:molecular chaperone HtpG
MTQPPAAELPPQTFAFQAEVKEVLDLVIHSLYSHREIFLRELISNASDALDKLRFEGLTDPGLASGEGELRIRLEVEPARRIVRVIDGGIGMSREELAENLGTIARSGTRRFLESVREREAAGAPALSGLIGQFGVGFYASFMVAEEITVESRRAGQATGARWRSKGQGEFELEDLPDAPRGTRVELRLKPREGAQEGEDDFADPRVLRELVHRYSDFVEYPIEMAAAHFPGEGDLKRRKAADGVEVVVLNSMKPLWARPKEEIEPQEYAQFYKHLTHGWDDPLETVHFKAEGANEYTALLFIPAERPLDLFDPDRAKSHVNLYVRRVFVMEGCEELLPAWLRFVHGVVDSQDLPLNVSREILQKNRAIAQIEKRLVKKLLDALGAMLESRRADYLRFWKAFGPVLKEGIVMDEEHSQRLAEIALFETSRGEEPTTLAEYVERMAEGQDAIWCLTGPDRRTLERSPHLESLRKKGWEALLLVDPVDEWVVPRLGSFKEKPLRPLERGELSLEAEAEKLDREQRERELRSLLEALEERLKPSVERVRLSTRLVESAAVLVDDEHSIGPHMERLLRQSGQEPPPRRRILELNPAHPVLERLAKAFEADPRSERIAEAADLLYGQALLAEGSPLPDPARFSRLVGELMLR